MKNPTAKNYEGPKSYQKLIHNVPKLNSLSKKQLKNVSPFSKKLVATHSFQQIENNQNVSLNNNSSHNQGTQGEAVVTSYSLSHSALSGKLESRQINEVVGRGLNIWRKSKKRLENYSVNKNVNSDSVAGANQIGDYWDVKRSSKKFSLSWKKQKSSVSKVKHFLDLGTRPNQNMNQSLIHPSSTSLNAIYFSKNHSKLSKKTVS